jgi:lauroyl/myristoyl acyltransferase
VAEPRPPSALLRHTLGLLTGLSRATGRGRYRVADVAGLALYAGQPDRRRRTIANHRRSDPGIDEREARRRARASFREYARTLADFIYALSLEDGAALRSAEVRGVEHVREGTARGRGVVLVLSHFGNWDMAAKLAEGLGLELTTVMAPFGPPALTDLVLWARQRHTLEVFTPENAARGLVRALRHNRCVALLCDVPGGGPTVVVDYCGGPVVFSAVPAWLAQRTGARLLPVACWREDWGYSADVHPAVAADPGENASEIMQRVAVVLEAAVRRRPEQWYPFGEVWAAQAPG